MRIIWDEPKRLANLDKHGLDFADVVLFDWATAVIETGHSHRFKGHRPFSGRDRSGDLRHPWDRGRFHHQLSASQSEGKEGAVMVMQAKKKFEEGRGYTREDWDAVDSPELTDDELASIKPAKEVLPPEFFAAVEEGRRSRGRPRVEAPKEAVTLRLDPALLRRFKATGKDWRARMVEVLEKAKV